jgi:arylsulfatase A-like enzyme
MLKRHVMITLASLSILLNGTTALGHTNIAATQPYNIILIINDQERYNLTASPDYQLPARQTLMRNGVTFRNHYNASAMCSPSRASFLTGTPPQVNGVYDQMEYSFVPSLNPERPNVASVLKKLGYRTAYFGKFEMDKELLLNVKNTTNYSTLANAYGIDVFNPDGDVGGTPQQGYHNDAYFVGEAVRWLRKNQAIAKKTHQPFFMVLSLLNPHDIMYADANLPNLPIAQNVPVPVILPPPNNSIYAKQWQITLPSTLTDSLSAPGMPGALLEYHKGWSAALGFIPTDRKDMWTYYSNYYLNLIRDNDQSLQQVIDAMNQMDLWKNTVVILTADHGEMGGAHGGLRGKGPMAYENNTHIPLIIDHPDAPHGVSCVALTSHIDLLPTLVGVTGLPAETRAAAIKGFVGHDFSNLLINPEKMDLHANRPGILFNYVGISTIDATFLTNKMVTSFKHAPIPPLTEINLNKRGFLSFVFDGRYKFARYYAPNAFNTPKKLEQILKYNDVQLFDLQTDPNERNNLALDSAKYKDLILRMNNLLNDLIAKEVGVNNGGFLPENVRPKTLPLTF